MRTFALLAFLAAYASGTELKGDDATAEVKAEAAAASDAVLLNFGRLVVGTASGLLCSPVGVYVAEVTTPTYRTSLGSIIRHAFARPLRIHDG